MAAGRLVRFMIPSQGILSEHEATVSAVSQGRKGNVLHLECARPVTNRDQHSSTMWLYREGIDNGYVLDVRPDRLTPANPSSRSGS